MFASSTSFDTVNLEILASESMRTKNVKKKNVISWTVLSHTPLHINTSGSLKCVNLGSFARLVLPQKWIKRTCWNGGKTQDLETENLNKRWRNKKN